MKKRKRPRRSVRKATASTLAEFQMVAPHVRRLYETHGKPLPFYDYLDSYEDAFWELAREAVSKHASLLGVHPVGNELFHSPDKQWGQINPEYSNLSQIFFTLPDEYAEYVEQERRNTKLAGSMAPFWTPEHDLRTIILVRDQIRSRATKDRDHAFVFKLATLAHEIGHVDDVEKRINFDTENATMDVIEAEAYANLYGLDLLASKHIIQAYQAIRDAMVDNVEADGYLGEVARRVVPQMKDHKFTRWSEITEYFTREDLASLPQETIEAFSQISDVDDQDMPA